MELCIYGNIAGKIRAAETWSDSIDNDVGCIAKVRGECTGEQNVEYYMVRVVNTRVFVGGE